MNIVAACAGILVPFAATSTHLQASELAWNLILFLCLAGIAGVIRWVLSQNWLRYTKRFIPILSKNPLNQDGKGDTRVKP